MVTGDEVSIPEESTVGSVLYLKPPAVGEVVPRAAVELKVAVVLVKLVTEGSPAAMVAIQTEVTTLLFVELIA
jgi:hypothetical protein